MSFGGTPDGDWRSVVVEGDLLLAATSAAQAITMWTLLHVTFNLAHPKRTENVLEAMEYILGIRAKSSIAQVRSVLPLLQA